MVYYPVRHRIMALGKTFFTRKNAPLLRHESSVGGRGGTARTRVRLQVNVVIARGNAPVAGAKPPEASGFSE
jgi:hypothetical protein